MSWTEIIAEVLVGLMLMFTSYQIGWKGNVKLIHRYHYVNVAPDDMKAFARGTGTGGMICAVSIVLVPVLNFLSRGELGYYTCLAACIVGVIVILYTIIKYNHSIFGTARRKIPGKK